MNPQDFKALLTVLEMIENDLSQLVILKKLEKVDIIGVPNADRKGGEQIPTGNVSHSSL